MYKKNSASFFLFNSVLLSSRKLTWIMSLFFLMNILISGWTRNGTFTSQRGNRNIACLLSLCKASPIFLQQYSLRAAMANIIKCPANIPSTHTYCTQTNTRTKQPLPSLYPYSFSPFFFFLAITQWQCMRERECIDLPKWAAISQGESTQRSCPWMGIAHFTWPPCL